MGNDKLFTAARQNIVIKANFNLQPKFISNCHKQNRR